MKDVNLNVNDSQGKSLHQVIERPGISPECLLANGIHHVTAQEAEALVGCRHTGLVLPYHVPDAGGRSPVFDPDGKQYCRLRKDGVTTGNKYYQPASTRVHAFLPLYWAARSDDTMVIVEGEFKSLSLTDPQQGYTIPTVGLSGFYGYHLARGEGTDFQLTSELKLALDSMKPKRIAFLGDADTSCNWQFSNAAVRFKSLLPGTEVILPRIPIDQPKGVDDCRGELRSDFERFFRRLLEDSIVLTGTEEPDELALRLLEQQLELAAKFPAGEKVKLVNRVVKMGACMSPEAREQLMRMVKKPLGIGITELRRMINAKLAEVHKEDLEVRLAKIRTKITNYHYAGRGYFRKTGDEYTPLSGDQNVERALRIDEGLAGSAVGGDSDAALGVHLIQKENGIKWAGEIAGRPAGPMHGPSGRTLVTRGPTIIEGSLSGDATLIIEMFLDFFGRSDGDPHCLTQFICFCGWLKQARQALQHPDDGLAGQALALVGADDRGKTFIPKEVISLCLGGRYAECGDYFTGKSNFNANLVGSELLHLSDVDPGADEKVLGEFRNRLKRVVANPAHTLNKKYADQISVEPIWRLVVSANRDSMDLRALPRLDPSIRQKIMLFACYRPACLPGEDSAERQEFRRKLHEALPAFLGQINTFTVPEKYRDGRFGVMAWHHPEVLRLLAQADPVVLLGTFLDEYLAGLRANQETLSAHDWFQVLAGKFGTRFTGHIADARELGRFLAALRDSDPGWAGRIEQLGKEAYGQHRNYRATWKITRGS